MYPAQIAYECFSCQSKKIDLPQLSHLSYFFKYDLF